jgi:hypothetical protein
MVPAEAHNLGPSHIAPGQLGYNLDSETIKLFPLPPAQIVKTAKWALTDMLEGAEYNNAWCCWYSICLDIYRHA